ncbi:MAG: FG-GAP-like repeat-containing protein, partial [Candidatus Thermoplasmatota archaeon]
TNWKYRIPITVKESYNYARTNEDATIKVKIDKTKISSSNELKLIDSNKNEVPFIKRFETVGANDITYELTFPISMSAGATNNYYLYYGNPGASTPSYTPTFNKNLPLNNFNKWNSPWGYHAYSEAVDIDDVDNDGTIELATTALEYTGSYWHLVLRVFNWKNKVLTQEGWTHASVWGYHEYGMGLVIADVDNDGDKEIVTCGMAYYATDGYWRSVLRIWNWNGASFTHETYTYWLSPWSRHSHAYKVYADDVDKDGVKEILIAGLEYSGSNWYSGLRIFSWIGGSLSSETWYYWLPEGPHDHAYNVYSDDVDNDGTKEIVVVGLTSVGGLWVTAYLRIFTWVGGALTTEAYERLRSDWNNQMYYHGVYICDVDRDGVKEILVGSMQYSGSNWYNDLRIYSWISNTLTLEKSEKWLAPGGSHGHVYSVYAADIDNDGIVEILTGGLHSDSAHSWVSGFLAIWTWNGNVLLKEREIIWKDSGTNTYDSHWGQALKAKDIDKDGRMEIVTYGFVTTSPYTAFLRIYTDIGGLSFTYGDIEGYYYFSGSYVSVVYDTLPTNTSLDYLKIFWTATVPAGTSLVFSTRTGDTNVPDDTWSVWSSNYTSSGSMITSPNRRYIQYRAIFICDGTKTPVLSDVSIQYNKFPSAPSLSKPTGDAIFNISTPSFILVSNDEDGDKLKYKLELSNDNFNSIYATYDLTLSTAGWSSADYAPGTNAQYTVQSSLPDGEYQWRGYSNDALVWSKVSEIRKFKIDTIAPISNIEQLPKYSLFLFTVSWSGEDAVSGINYYDIYVSDNGASFKLWKSKTKETSAIFTGQEGHKYEFYSIATDKAGNREVKSIGETETIVDSVSPISSVHQLPNYENKTTFKISWSGKDSGSGIKNYAIYYSENESDFKVWLSETTNNSADFTGLNGVKYSFYSIATDFAGFAEIKDKADTTTIIDALPPISKISQLPEYQTSTSFSVYWSGEDDTSGISKYTIYVSIDNGSYEIWLKDVETTYGTYNGKDGHSYSFYSIATDKAGNIEEKMPVKEAYTKIDTNPPWAYVLPLKQYQNSLSFKVSWTSGGIDVKSYDIFVSDNDAQFETWLEGIDYTSAIFTGLDGHKYKFFATCKDKAGNEVQRPFTFDTFTTIDISPPEITSFLINEGADSTSILGVSLKISAYDKVSGIKDISYSNDNKTFTFWEFYA